MAQRDTSGATTRRRLDRARRAWIALSGLALVAGLALAGAGDPPRTADLRPTFVSSCIGYCQHPTNAGKVFRWGLEDWREEYEVGALSSHWHSDHLDQVSHRYGMLSIEALPDTGSISVWPDNQSAQYGRWESRVRAIEFSDVGEKYTFTWGLVPVDEDARRCGANDIVMSAYQTGDTVATGAVRVAPDSEYTFKRKRDLRSRAWHTYAVEVTPDHVSWFVDTQVMRTERRPEALSGLEYRPQFQIDAVPGQQMRRSWMQMDWTRYYTLKRVNAQPIRARQMTLGTYGGAC